MSVLLGGNSLPGSIPPAMLLFQSRTGSAESKGNYSALPLESKPLWVIQVLEGQISGCTDGGATPALPACYFLDVFPGDHTQSPPERIIFYALCEIKPILFKLRPMRTRRKYPEVKLTL